MSTETLKMPNKKKVSVRTSQQKIGNKKFALHACEGPGTHTLAIAISNDGTMFLTKADDQSIMIKTSPAEIAALTTNATAGNLDHLLK